jgi:hypothetical protein
LKTNNELKLKMYLVCSTYNIVPFLSDFFNFFFFSRNELVAYGFCHVPTSPGLNWKLSFLLKRKLQKQNCHEWNANNIHRDKQQKNDAKAAKLIQCLHTYFHFWHFSQTA